MTAKEYLKQIEKWQRKIDSIQTQSNGKIERLTMTLEELYSQADGLKAIDYNKDLVQVSPKNTLEELVMLINEVSEDLAKAIYEAKTKTAAEVRELEDKIRHVIDQIDELNDSRYCTLLKLRYVEGKRFEEIACIMEYAYRHTTRLHGEALQAFKENMS